MVHNVSPIPSSSSANARIQDAAALRFITGALGYWATRMRGW